MWSSAAKRCSCCGRSSVRTNTHTKPFYCVLNTKNILNSKAHKLLWGVIKYYRLYKLSLLSDVGNSVVFPLQLLYPKAGGFLWFCSSHVWPIMFFLTHSASLCLQAHVHGDARSPEDEQPHGDEHHARSLPRGPQDPGGVPDSGDARLTDLKTLFITEPLQRTESHGVTLAFACDTAENIYIKKKIGREKVAAWPPANWINLKTQKPARFQLKSLWTQQGYSGCL